MMVLFVYCLVWWRRQLKLIAKRIKGMKETEIRMYAIDDRRSIVKILNLYTYISVYYMIQWNLFIYQQQ